MKGKEDLRRPGPIQHERPASLVSTESAFVNLGLLDPQHHPSNLKDALDGHAPLRPPKCSGTSSKYFLQGDTQSGTGHHRQVAQGQLPGICGQ